jgi:16S rRNA (uracil1498-N3)-methyltransferase
VTVRVLVPAGALGDGDRELDLTDAEHHYLARVRRAAVGDAITVFDGAGHAADGVVVAIAADRARVRVGAVATVAAPIPHITSIIPLIKGDRLDTCVEKLTEVGVDAIVLYDAARAVVRLAADKVEGRRVRLAAVAEAAARQAGRASLPTVSGPVTLAEALAAAAACDSRWVAHPAADPPEIPRQAAIGVRFLAILTGPEGGLTADELAAAATAGFVAVGLGPYVLRAETAPIVAAGYARITSLR